MYEKKDRVREIGVRLASADTDEGDRASEGLSPCQAHKLGKDVNDPI